MRRAGICKISPIVHKPIVIRDFYGCDQLGQSEAAMENALIEDSTCNHRMIDGNRRTALLLPFCLVTYI